MHLLVTQEKVSCHNQSMAVHLARESPHIQNNTSAGRAMQRSGNCKLIRFGMKSDFES